MRAFTLAVIALCATGCTARFRQSWQLDSTKDVEGSVLRACDRLGLVPARAEQGNFYLLEPPPADVTLSPPE